MHHYVCDSKTHTLCVCLFTEEERPVPLSRVSELLERVTPPLSTHNPWRLYPLRHDGRLSRCEVWPNGMLLTLKSYLMET